MEIYSLILNQFCITEDGAACISMSHSNYDAMCNAPLG